MGNPFTAARAWVQNKVYGPQPVPNPDDQALFQHPDYLMQSNKTALKLFPGTDLMLEVLPEWLNAPKSRGPRNIFTLPDNKIAYGLTSSPAPRPPTASPTDVSVGLVDAAKQEALKGTNLGIGTVMHELAHYFQYKRPNFNSFTNLSGYLDAAKEMHGTGYSDTAIVAPEEQEAELARNRFLKLWQAKQANEGLNQAGYNEPALNVYQYLARHGPTWVRNP
jgi:hypothetical protein